MEGHTVYIICKKDASGCAETLLHFMQDLSAGAATCAAAHPDRTSKLAVYSPSSSSDRSILLRMTRK